MRRAKLIDNPDTTPPPPSPKSRKVRVDQREHRSYIEDEPILDEITFDAAAPASEVDAIEAFLRQIEEDRNYVLHVSLLHNFDRDGRRGVKALKTFVTNFPFTSTEVETYRSIAQQAWPAGGQFQFELREGGGTKRMWDERIAPAPGFRKEGSPAFYQPAAATPSPAVVINPAAVSPQPLQNLTEQFGFVKELLSLAKDMIPPAAQPAQATSAETTERTASERLFDAAIVGALQNPKTDVMRVVDALAPARSRGFLESFLESPAALELVRMVGPGLYAWLMTAASSQAQARGLAGAPPNPGQANPATGAGAPPSVPPQLIDPADRAWRRVVRRLVEDCYEGAGILSAAEAILDLEQQFPQFSPLVIQVIESEPDGVVDLCAMIMDTPQDQAFVSNLKTVPICLQWIGALQTEIKTLAEERRQEDKDNGGDETETGD